MQYLLLIYHNETEWLGLTEEERSAVRQGYPPLMKRMVESGSFKAGSELQATSSATTVRVRNGKASVTDGPFAETREQLAGFFLIEGKNLDEAIALAAEIPSARNGSIEVRPLK